MKNSIIVIAIFFTLFPVVAFSDVVYFKNGKSIQTLSAWEDGDKVMAFQKGKIVGYPKKDVARIQKRTIGAGINEKEKTKTNIEGNCPKNQVYVSDDIYDDQWPFTIKHGCIECKSNAVIMHSGRKTYNINGKARVRYKNVYIDSWKIRKPHPNKVVAADGGKMLGCLYEIIRKGLNLCR